MRQQLQIVTSQQAARYGFPEGHPFASDRTELFFQALRAADLDLRIPIVSPSAPAAGQLELFHVPEQVEFVRQRSGAGTGYLDYGDTPVFPGVFEAAAGVVHATLDAGRRILDGVTRSAFVPVAGMHHAMRDRSAGFCVFNDVGVLVEWLRTQGLSRIAYVDIDVHHGDGVFYGFEEDPDLVVADIHEDGRFLFPGTGHAQEQGKGAALGTKLNIPLLPGAGDEQFAEAWMRVERHLESFPPEFIIFQCGADGLDGDPLADLAYSERSHALATRGLLSLAEHFCEGRLLALGGGGYLPANVSAAWTQVVTAMASGAD